VLLLDGGVFCCESEEEEREIGASHLLSPDLKNKSHQKRQIDSKFC